MLYSGQALKEISFPLGGIGSGCIGLSGNGTLIDFEIFNRPAKGSDNGYTFFAVRAEDKHGNAVTKVLSGDVLKDLAGQYSGKMFSGFGYGVRNTSMQGFPHFRSVSFDGRFPVARLYFSDEDFPGRVKLTAFNPMIPLKEDDSSLPAAFFEIEIENGERDIDYTLVFACKNPFEGSVNTETDVPGGAGVCMSGSVHNEKSGHYGNMTAAFQGEGAFCQRYWYRGGWQDGIATFWRELTENRFRARDYDAPGKGDICCVGTRFSLQRGETGGGRCVLTWYVPNRMNDWSPYRDETGADVLWKNYYAVLFDSSQSVCRYALQNWTRLFEETVRFECALHSATLPGCVIEACASTLSVLKSPTVLRLEDGSFYGWEGVHENSGSCEGTCTHVWSYQYALPFLFPALERSLRMNEFTQSVYPSGGMRFRMPLPKGRREEMGRACADGQMASVFKTYREWKLSGDSDWLRQVWPTVKRVLAYAWSPENADKWDEDKKGVLTGRQHHTLDMELFGPSAWLEGMYLTALRAAEEMALYLEDNESAKEYRALFEGGYRFTKENLFGGEYFIQKIKLTDKSIPEKFCCTEYWNDETGEIKYQIAEGCAIDQMLGQFHAGILGLGDIFDPAQRKTALDSMLKYNYKPTMRNFANPWRVFAVNDEAGTVICEYPTGVKKPAIPIPYCEEAMHGFEYAFAGLLAEEGRIEDAVKVVEAVRSRYRGYNRNPYNEIECGSNYARSMAAFALIPILSGYEFDLARSMIGFSPKLEGEFQSPFFIGSGWGVLVRKEKETALFVKGGECTLSRVRLSYLETVKSVLSDGREIPFSFENGCVVFEKTTACESLIIKS